MLGITNISNYDEYLKACELVCLYCSHSKNKNGKNICEKCPLQKNRDDIYSMRGYTEF